MPAGRVFVEPRDLESMWDTGVSRAAETWLQGVFSKEIQAADWN